MLTKLLVCFTSILTVIALSKEHVYTWCDAYETFCLFSYGSKLKVSNLTEAQEVCTEINNNSWPVEITSQHVEDVFKQFLINVSLPLNVNVILNAVFQNNNWFWIKNKSDFSVSKFSVDDNIVSYGTASKITNVTYAVICTVECKAEWKHYNNSSVFGAHAHLEYQTYDECKNACETVRSHKCTAFEWNPGPKHPGCWIFNDPNIANILPGNDPGVSHDIINRTSKSIDQCIGKLKNPTNSTDNNNSNQNNTPLWESSEKTKILLGVLIPMFFLIIIVCIVVGVLFCRRKLPRRQTSENLKNKNNLNTKFPKRSSLNYPDIDFEKQQQRQQETNVDSRNNVEETNMSFVLTGEPKRYNGPGGEAYTEVDKTF